MLGTRGPTLFFKTCFSDIFLTFPLRNLSLVGREVCHVRSCRVSPFLPNIERQKKGCVKIKGHSLCNCFSGTLAQDAWVRRTRANAFWFQPSQALFPSLASKNHGSAEVDTLTCSNRLCASFTNSSHTSCFMLTRFHVFFLS